MNHFATPRDLIPENHCVLGTMLRPFSLGHHLLLERIDSRLAGCSHGEVQGLRPEDLSLAVFICAVPFAATQEAIVRGEWKENYHRWNRTLKPHWWQRTRFDFDTEATRFLAYLKQGYQRAPVVRSAGGLPLSAPWECLLQARLQSHGWSSQDIMEGYLPALWYAYHTLQEIYQMDNYHPRAGGWQKVFWTAEDQVRWEAIPRN
jgi:hypothetical protein